MDGRRSGHVLSYEESGRPEVSYWIGREYWGQGLASRALSDFLAHVNVKRPIYARAAADNRASLRVLEKCGSGSSASLRALPTPAAPRSPS